VPKKENTLPSENSGNPKGRPKLKKNPVGRPKGESTIMAEYRNRMLNSPKSRRVLEAIFDAALNDDHKNQAAAWKLIVDRIAPLSGFDKMAGSTPRNAIQINISGIGGTVSTEDISSGDIIDGEVVE
jgi:hypothetical protein